MIDHLYFVLMYTLLVILLSKCAWAGKGCGFAYTPYSVLLLAILVKHTIVHTQRPPPPLASAF